MEKMQPIKKYERVMPRVYNRSKVRLRTSSLVTQHGLPSTVRVGAKPAVSSSNISSGVYSDLPIVLNDYKEELTKLVHAGKRTSVVKPRRTLKSLEPDLSPPRSVPRSQDLAPKPRYLPTRASAPSLVSRETDKWSGTHVAECSSRSHTKLKELKDEIKAYQDTEKLMKLRSHLYKSCGVVLDDVGQVVEDKAVQVDTPHTDSVRVIER